jgi:hypothetical protein
MNVISQMTITPIARLMLPIWAKAKGRKGETVPEDMAGIRVVDSTKHRVACCLYTVRMELE